MTRRAGVLLLLPLLVGSCDIGLEGTPDGVAITFTGEDIPLLPAGFPVYPKAFSTESMEVLVDETLSSATYRAAISSVAGEICANLGFGQVCVDDLLNNAAYNSLDAAINDKVPELRQWVGKHLVGQLRFYNPGPLGTGVNEQIGGMFRGLVTFERVGLRMKVTNRTSDVWGVPLKFSLYMGDGGTVARKGGLVKTGESDAYTFLLLPGETKTLEVEDVPDLVSALNHVRSLAIDYDANIEAAELELSSFAQWLTLDRTKDSDNNGIADDLARWAIVFEELTITVDGRGEIDLPVDVPEWLYDFVPL